MTSNIYSVGDCAADVSFEYRQDTWSQKWADHDSQFAGRVERRGVAVEKVCDSESRKTPATTWLRRREMLQTAQHVGLLTCLPGLRLKN